MLCKSVSVYPCCVSLVVCVERVLLVGNRIPVAASAAGSDAGIISVPPGKTQHASMTFRRRITEAS